MCNCLFTFYITDTVIDASCFVLLMHLVWMATIYATRSSNAPRAAMFTLNQSPGMCRTCLIDLKSFFVLFIANVSQNILVMSALERISMNTSIAHIDSMPALQLLHAAAVRRDQLSAPE